MPYHLIHPSEIFEIGRLFMKKTILTAIILLSSASVAYTQASKLPSFSLPDPGGAMHSSAQLGAKGVVVIVSAPTLKDKAAQEGWAKDLVATKGSNPASLILIEDMTASAFAGIAESHMKKDWKPGTLPILLEDKTGKVHGAFGVGKDQTKVFVYDQGGNLLYSTAAAPSVAAAKTVWAKLAK